MAAAEAKPVWLFYHVQGERGESAMHPNACKLRSSAPNKLTLDDVLAAFPLGGTGAFHFRFQMAMPDKQTAFLDLVNPGDAVPTVGGNVVAKVLRMDTAKCAVRCMDGLRIRPGVVSTRGASADDAPASSPTTTSGSRSSAGPSGAQRSATSAAAVSNSGGAAAPSPSRAPGAPSPAPQGPPTAALGPSPGMKPVRAVTIDPSVVVPDIVDDDLADKSDYVKAKVMERRNEARKAHADRLAEVEARDAAAALEQESRDSLKAQYGGPLTEWAQEHGRMKNIRVLISTLQNVLWEGAKWEPVPLAKLVIPSKVKFYFMRAITLVHPDKQNTMETAQKYVATQIFHSLEQAYRTFQETEMGG